MAFQSWLPSSRPVNWYCLILRHVTHVIKHVNMRAGCTGSFFHSVAVGFAILYSQRWTLVNINASTVTFIEIGGNCPCYFAMLTNTTLNRLDSWLWDVNPMEQLCFDSIVDLQFQSQQIAQSLSSQILFGISGKRFIRVCLNQGTANYVNTVYFIHQGKYSNQSHAVCLR